MKKNIIKILFIFIICLLIVNLKFVFAVTESELEDEISNIDNQIDQANTEIAGIEDQMSNELKQINRLNLQIQEYEDDINDIQDDIDAANASLEDKKKELENVTDTYEEQKALIETRLIAIYESSKTTYLDILVGSSDLSDFISKYYLLEEIASADNDVIEELAYTKENVEDETKKLEEAANDVETLKESLIAKQGSLEVLIKDKTNLISTLSEEELDLQNQLEQFEEDKKKIQNELEELARQNAIKASMTPSECGYISPLVGKTSQNITTGFHGYTGHTGVDFAVSSGTEVVAVKAGTVVISDALINSNGAYRSYGEYVVVDHKDGTMTLYAHGTPNSRRVEVRR